LTSYVPRTSDSADPLVGSIVDDRYHVQHRIGKGGMGSVYLADHLRLHRRVAIKTLHPELMAHRDAVTRFHREALAAAAIGNEHVVNVTDMGQLDGGGYYLVLEFLEGADLGYTVASEGMFSIARSLGIALQLCDALEAVHAAGIVHRDLKPENLFLVSNARHPDFLKVLDFGVCKIREARLGERHITDTGVAIGTPHFMAPEQVEGRRDIDGRVDVYAFGAILHFLLVGEPPFDAPTVPRLFMRICQDPPPRVRAKRPGVPRALEQLVLGALSKEPAQRPAGPAELRQMLAPLAAAAAASESALPSARRRGRVALLRSGVREHEAPQSLPASGSAAPSLRELDRTPTIPSIAPPSSHESLPKIPRHGAPRLICALLIAAVALTVLAMRDDGPASRDQAPSQSGGAERARVAGPALDEPRGAPAHDASEASELRELRSQIEPNPAPVGAVEGKAEPPSAGLPTPGSAAPEPARAARDAARTARVTRSSPDSQRPTSARTPEPVTAPANTGAPDERARPELTQPIPRPAGISPPPVEAAPTSPPREPERRPGRLAERELLPVFLATPDSER
jgi:eukaryotic-like serine/threonine-protein kinase